MKKFTLPLIALMLACGMASAQTTSVGDGYGRHAVVSDSPASAIDPYFTMIGSDARTGPNPVPFGNPAPRSSAYSEYVAYANYIQSQLTGTTRLVDMSKVQLAFCSADKKDRHLLRADHFLALMTRTKDRDGATEQGFRWVSLYQDSAVAAVGNAMEACGETDAGRQATYYERLIADRIRVTNDMIHAAKDETWCSDGGRYLDQAQDQLSRMQRVLDRGFASYQSVTEVSTHQNEAMADIASALRACKVVIWN